MSMGGVDLSGHPMLVRRWMLYNFEQLPSRDLIEMAKLDRGSKPLELRSHSPEDNQPSIIGIAEDDRQGLRTIFNWTEKRRSQSIQLSGLGAAPLHDCSFRSESCSCRAKEIAFSVELHQRRPSMAIKLWAQSRRQ